MKPTRPALRYYGGKWRIGQWVISHFPAHECYVEPYGGGASVLLQKARSPLEVYNDLDGAAVNFFRVLRERQGELARSVEGMVVISGYPSGLYQLLYERYGWKRMETAARTGGHGVTSVFRTEALWLSPRTVDALERRDLPLFNIGRGFGILSGTEVSDEIRMGGGDGGGSSVVAIGGGPGAG